jgi:uncharacterized membrane protein YgdD (TMEM256/DUF423 family)
MPSARWILTAGGALLALATVAGAFGAHALHSRLAPEQLELYETAVRYFFYNALGVLGIGAVARTSDAAALRWAAALVIGGLVLFCGSLFALAAGAPRATGIITPLGGTALIAGWIAFALGVWRA